MPACDPACAAGYACIEVDGKMACKLNCLEPCGPGLACDMTAVPPACVLPEPKNFTLLVSWAERFQTGYHGDYQPPEGRGEWPKAWCLGAPAATQGCARLLPAGGGSKRVREPPPSPSTSP